MTQNRKTFFDQITGKLVKIGALIGAVAAIATGVVKVSSVLPTPKPDLKNDGDCVIVEVTGPREVPFDEWYSMDLRLTGSNNCENIVNAFVLFKAPASTLLLSSPFPNCSDLNELVCWEGISLDPKSKVDLPLQKPNIKKLAILKMPVPIGMNWHLYNGEKKLLKSGTTTVSVFEKLEDSAPRIVF